MDEQTDQDASWTEIDLDRQRISEREWKCPNENCGAVLSRKQTLKAHLQCIHNQVAGNPVSRYKQYDADNTLPVPRTTEYNRKRKQREETEDEERGSDIGPNRTDLVDFDCSSVPMEICDTDESNNDSSSESETESASSSDGETEQSCDKDSPSDIPEACGTPLYIIPPSECVYTSRITVEQHLLAVCSYASKYNISTQQFEDLLLLLSLHLPENNLCELDIQKIKQQCGFDSGIKNIHEYCTQCGALKPNIEIDVCETPDCGARFDSEKNNGSFFVSGNIASQMKMILEREGNWDKVQGSHNRKRSGVITNITDGSAYLKLREDGQFLAVPSNNITFTFFTDGIPLFKSSKVSLWPVYLVINEIPPNERFLKKNMILWGLWQGVAKPKMNTYFKKLITDLTDVHAKGVSLSINGCSVICKAMLVVLTMDLQARAYVLNMTQHNGECACIFCE